MKNIGIAVIILLFIIGILYVSQKPKPTSPVYISPKKEIIVDQEKYIPYSETAFTDSKQNGKTLLFFAAGNWCNTCSVLDNELSKEGNLVPDDVTVLKIDYDNDKEMNKKYGVVAQHTLILLDENGYEITRWVGGDLNATIEKLNSVS